MFTKLLHRTLTTVTLHFCLPINVGLRRRRYAFRRTARVRALGKMQRSIHQFMEECEAASLPRMQASPFQRTLH